MKFILVICWCYWCGVVGWWSWLVVCYFCVVNWWYFWWLVGFVDVLVWLVGLCVGWFCCSWVVGRMLGLFVWNVCFCCCICRIFLVIVWRIVGVYVVSGVFFWDCWCCERLVLYWLVYFWCVVVWWCRWYWVCGFCLVWSGCCCCWCICCCLGCCVVFCVLFVVMFWFVVVCRLVVLKGVCWCDWGRWVYCWYLLLVVFCLCY